MTMFLLTFALIVATGAEDDDANENQTPQEAVAVMNTVLVKKDFKAFYETHCHKHLRDQLDADEFVDSMKSERGAAIVNLFAELQAAIGEKKGDDVLIAREQKQPDEFEFILIDVKDRLLRNGRQWHLELKQEDGKWKLMDTD